MPRKALRSGRRQVRGTASNIRETFSEFTIDDALPSGIAGGIQEFIVEDSHNAAGLGTRRRQLYALTALTLVAILTAWVTGPVAIVIYGTLLLLWLIYWLRQNPWFNKKWGSGTRRAGLQKERDVPLWRRD